MCQLCTNPAGEKSCCCFNLSIGLLVIAAYFGVIGGLEIYQAESTALHSNTQFVGGIINCSVGGYICLCVLLGFFKLGLIAYLFTFVAFVVTLVNAVFKVASFINDWVEWGTALSNGTEKFRTEMVLSSISQLLTISIILGFANFFWSAACVYRAGGNGCEYKRYTQIEAEKERMEAKKLDTGTNV